MGARHFKQMYEDALEIDRRALFNAMKMRAPLRVERESPLGPVWKDVPQDKLMDLARKLLELDNGFTKHLKLMLLDGDIIVFMSDRHGKIHKIRDPDVIDFDDPVMSEEEFYDLVEAYLTDNRSCSGEQN